MPYNLLAGFGVGRHACCEEDPQGGTNHYQMVSISVMHNESMDRPISTRAWVDPDPDAPRCGDWAAFNPAGLSAVQVQMVAKCCRVVNQ